MNKLHCLEKNSKTIYLYTFNAKVLSPKYFLPVIDWILEWKNLLLGTAGITSKPNDNLLPFLIPLLLEPILYPLKDDIRSSQPMLLSWGIRGFCATTTNTGMTPVLFKGQWCPVCWQLCPLPPFLAQRLANHSPCPCPSCSLLFLWPCPVGMWQPALTWWHCVIVCSISVIKVTSSRWLKPA